MINRFCYLQKHNTTVQTEQTDIQIGSSGLCLASPSDDLMKRMQDNFLSKPFRGCVLPLQFRCYELSLFETLFTYLLLRPLYSVMLMFEKQQLCVASLI